MYYNNEIVGHNTGRFRNVYMEALLQVENSVWVVAVGKSPENHHEYQWLILSSPNKVFVYILARNPDLFRARYERDALNHAKRLGFTKSLNKPIKTYHSKACRYSSLPDPAI